MSARAVIAAMSAYVLELREAGVKLNQNESPYDVPVEVKQQVLARIGAREWNIYPDFEASEVRTRLGEAYGIAAENVLVGNGSNELLAAAIATFVGPGTNVVVPRPSFALYEKLVVIAGGTVVPIAIDPATGVLPLDAMTAAAREGSVVIACSPNNPTGGVLPDGGLEALLATGATVLFDRAYGEFALDAMPPLHDRLVTFSTFSKAWGLAALRVGWLASTAATCREIRKVKLPYSLNVFSEAAAIAVLERPEIRASNVARTIRERVRLSKALAAIDGVSVFPTAANFVTFRLERNATEVFDALCGLGVLVRNVSSYEGLANCLRVSVGTPEQNDAFLQALQGALQRRPHGSEKEMS